MEEQIIKQSEASYFKSATKVLKGYVTLTEKRIIYSGIQERAQMNHGVVGNVIRDKMEKAMGYGNEQEELIFDLPLAQVEAELKRYGLSKRLLIRDSDGKEFKLTIWGKKAERESWPGAINDAKSAAK
ncbi:MAG: hypothetical protein MI810_02030 [Flavobacteriales bacterium]|nr:hypothetical protein [Flavobacteriales bacterium]